MPRLASPEAASLPALAVTANATQPRSAGLEPYTEVLDRRKIDHLLRRIGFGALFEERTSTFRPPARNRGR